MDPGDRHRPDPRGAARAGWSRSWTTASRPRPRRPSPRHTSATRTCACRTCSPSASACWSASGSTACRCRRSSSTAPRRERDEAGQLYMQFLLAGPDRVGLLHADPHPGNFRLLARRAARASSTSAPSSASRTGCLRHGPAAHPGHRRGRCEHRWPGCGRSGSCARASTWTPSGCWSTSSRSSRPLRVDSFHFTRAWLRGIFADLKDPRKPNYTVGLRLNLPREYFLIHRVWLGGIGVLCQLDSTVPGRATVNALIPGADLPPIGSHDGSGRPRSPRRSARGPRRDCRRHGELTGPGHHQPVSSLLSIARR